MRVGIKHAELVCKSFHREGEISACKANLELAWVMKRRATLFSNQTTLADHVDILLHNAKVLAGFELVVKGNTPEEKAGVLFATLTDIGLSKYVGEEPPAPITVAVIVWQGLEAARQFGATSIFGWPAVMKIAEAIGFHRTAR